LYEGPSSLVRSCDPVRLRHQFNSLATFAGFITAGIAVGLQTILLSVAAYFFIIGRYGVKVGDRITIASVTGDVIDVGLVRFYMMELAGSGTELKATGRVAVFSNAVLFQAGTPLYKQIPGTEYAWRELVVNIAETANYKIAYEAIMKEIHAVYEGYRTKIEQQHQVVQNWMQTAIDPPAIESHLQFNQSGLELWARLPVQIKQASETDEKLTQALLELMEKHAEVKSAVGSTPLIQASVTRVTSIQSLIHKLAFPPVGNVRGRIEPWVSRLAILEALAKVQLAPRPTGWPYQREPVWHLAE
jgi:hypothetical protein